MNTRNYISFLILIVISTTILVFIHSTGYLSVKEASKESVAKVTPIYVTIDKELLKSLLPANE